MARETAAVDLRADRPEEETGERAATRAAPGVPLSELRLGVDVGGTFTDLVALVDGQVVTAKVPSTPGDQSEGVLARRCARGEIGGAARSPTA